MSGPKPLGKLLSTCKDLNSLMNFWQNEPWYQANNLRGAYAWQWLCTALWDQCFERLDVMIDELRKIFDDNRYMYNIPAICSSPYFGGNFDPKEALQLMQSDMTMNPLKYPSGCVLFLLFKARNSPWAFYLIESPTYDQSTNTWINTRQNVLNPKLGTFPYSMKKMVLQGHHLVPVTGACHVSGTIPFNPNPLTLQQLEESWGGVNPLPAFELNCPSANCDFFVNSASTDLKNLALNGHQAQVPPLQQQIPLQPAGGAQFNQIGQLQQGQVAPIGFYSPQK